MVNAIFRNKNELFRQVVIAWKNIFEEVLYNLIESMPCEK